MIPALGAESMAREALLSRHLVVDIRWYACRTVPTVLTTRLQPSRLRAELALAFCTLLWGSTFVVVKNSLDDSSVFVFLALRFTLAGVCMAVFRPQVFRVLQREETFAGARLGFFMFCGYAFQTAGLRYTTASNSGFITGSSVVLVPLILALFWGKRVTLWVYFGTIAAAAGLYFLTVPVTGVAHLNRGDVLTFLSERDSLAADALPFHFAAVDWHRGLRGVRDGCGLLVATLGAAIHDAEPCGDYFHAGTGVRGPYFLLGIARTARDALNCGSGTRTGGNSCGRIAGTACSAGVAGAHRGKRLIPFHH